jgi:hypothetical protein
LWRVSPGRWGRGSGGWPRIGGILNLSNAGVDKFYAWTIAGIENGAILGDLGPLVERLKVSARKLSHPAYPCRLLH